MSFLKITRILRYIAPILVVLIVLLTVIDRLIPGVSLSDVHFFQSKKFSAYTVSDEIEEISLLNTSEYRMKMIFPFDFVEKDFNWWKVKRLYLRGDSGVGGMEKELTLYKACLDAGFDPALDVYNFIVLTAVVKAGITLRGDLNFFIEVDDDLKKIISLSIPEAEITDYYIEDRKPDNDNFPDASLTPVQWRDLVNFLNPLIREKVVLMGILDNAEKNSEQLIEKY